MSAETKTPAASQQPTSLTTVSTGTWNKEDLLAGLAEIERRKNDPEYIAYVQRGIEGAAEARRVIDEEERRRLDKGEGK